VFASYKGLDFVNAEELKSAFIRANLPDKPSVVAVTESVHCECSIILEILKQFPTSPIVVIEVGISKSMCWLCNEFFRAFQKKHPHITVYYSTCHAKYTAGWRFPKATPVALRHSMERFIEEELLEVHSKALRKRKSDSEPREDNFHSTSIQDLAAKTQKNLPRDMYKRKTQRGDRK
jgi:hypothetical protein